jgi:proline racemase
MRITTVDAHVAGAAVRLVTSGVPSLGSGTMREKQEVFERDADRIRRLLCQEPRGHSGVVGVVLTEPAREDADAGLLFFDAYGYSALCGHALMGAVGLAVTRGLLTVGDRRTVEIDTVAGPVTAHLLYAADSTCTIAVSYDAPTAQVCRARARVLAGRRTVVADIAWSGSELLAIVDAESAGVPLVPSRTLDLQRAGVEITSALNEAVRVTPPDSPSPAPIGGAVFIGPASSEAADLRSVAVYAEGTVDRSPSGSGITAVCAVLAGMGTVLPGSVLRHESLTGTTMTATVRDVMMGEGEPQVRVSIAAAVFVTGEHVFVQEEGDPIDGLDWA